LLKGRIVGRTQTTQTIQTVSSREFVHNVSAAKRVAAEGATVIITDRGEPAFALINIAEYQRLSKTVLPRERLRLGSLLVSIAREAGGLTDAEAEHFNQLRDKTPAEPLRFE
jgi:prevent-host-death family protein